MFIIRFFRYIRGYVHFTVYGGLIERFINLCAQGGIPLWGGRRTAVDYTAYTTASSYKKLRPIAAKSGARLRLSGKRGAPFIRHRYRKRYGLAFGIACFLFFMIVMSNFVWEVQIHGAETVSEQEVMDSLHEHGVKPGAFIHNLDTRMIEMRIMLDVDELSWIAINIQGSIAMVEIKERTMPPETIDDGTPCNVVAARDGQIIRMEVYEGQAVYRVGDGVAKGDILVSGILTDNKNRTQLKHARATVIARVEETFTARVPLTQQIITPTGEEKSRSYFRIFNADLPLFLFGRSDRMYEIEAEQSTFHLFGMALPFGMRRETLSFVGVETVTYTEEEAYEQALALVGEYEGQLDGTAVIAGKEAVGYIEDGVFVLEASYVLEMNIAVQIEILEKSSTN